MNNDSDDNDSSDDNGGGSDNNGGGSNNNGCDSGDNDGLNDNGDDNEDFDNNEFYTEDDNRSFLIEQFTAPDFDDFDFESDDEYSNLNIKFNDSWILLWILKYQARFCLPDVAINSLIKFFQIVL